MKNTLTISMSLLQLLRKSLDQNNEIETYYDGGCQFLLSWFHEQYNILKNCTYIQIRAIAYSFFHLNHASENSDLMERIVKKTKG